MGVKTEKEMQRKIPALNVNLVFFQELHGANIRPVMVTGDNILTAVSVSRKCGLLRPGERLIHVVAGGNENEKPSIEYHLLTDSQAAEAVTDKLSTDTKLDIDANSYQFALDGRTFGIICSQMKDDLLPLIVRRGAVFARMRPDMKQRLVESLQELGYLVGMCGDGANDCGALKAANAGISLSEAEASVASPFTSKTPDILCVPRLVRESRAALVTSFGIFKYMAAYSLTQFVSVMILYEIYSNLSDAQFLYIDLFIITTLATMFGLNPTFSGTLANRPPEKSLISFRPLFSLLSQMVIIILFQVGAMLLVQDQDWFVGFDYENPCCVNTTAEEDFNASGLLEVEKCDPKENPVASYENYAVFFVSQFQYIILAVVFAKGAPYRKNIFHNLPMLIDIFVLSAFSIYLVLKPATVFINGFIIGFELFLPPDSVFNFRLILLALVGANWLACLVWEGLVTDIIVNKLTSNSRKKLPYDLLEEDMASRRDWPPLSPEPSSPSGSPPPNSQQAADNGVVITGQGVSNLNDAFDSLFSTPASISHSTAAICLNPPPPPTTTTSPRRADTEIQAINLKSSVESTPKKSFSSALSTPGSTATESSASDSKFVSCDSVLIAEVDKSAPLVRGNGDGAADNYLGLDRHVPLVRDGCSVGYR